MKKLSFFFLLVFSFVLFSNEVDYSQCLSLQDAIAKESQEIQSTVPYDHEELAQLYVSRAESWLLLSEFGEAIEDFQTADFHLGHVRDKNLSSMVAFRIALGEVVSYDNLAMHSLSEKALDRLQVIVEDIGCTDYRKQKPCQGLALSKKSSYDLCHSDYEFPRSIIKLVHSDFGDIIGPDVPPRARYCEEVVIGVGSSMQVIAGLAPSPIIRAALIGIIEALKHKCLKCCESGEFWKACVAPIARKWREWNGNKKNNLPWDDWV